MTKPTNETKECPHCKGLGRHLTQDRTSKRCLQCDGTGTAADPCLSEKTALHHAIVTLRECRMRLQKIAERRTLSFVDGEGFSTAMVGIVGLITGVLDIVVRMEEGE